MLQTLFQLALLVCTSCLYFFLGVTPGGRTGPGGRGPMPGNGGGGAPPGGGGGGGGPPPGGGGGGGGPPPGNGGGGGGGGPPPGGGGGGGGGGAPPPGGGGGGGGGGAAPPGGGGGAGGPPEKQRELFVRNESSTSTSKLSCLSKTLLKKKPLPDVCCTFSFRPNNLLLRFF